MELAQLRRIYERSGPFATVYLEGRSPREDAGNETRLRWRELRERLQSQGAPESALAAVDETVLGSQPGEMQANGRVIVADSDSVVLQAPWDAARGSGDDAVWQDLPDLGRYVRESLGAIRALVVVASQTAATVRQEVVAEHHEPRELDAQDIEGTANEQVHKPRGQAESHKRIQRRADEAVSQNVKDIVDQLLRTTSDFRPQILVLAGETKGRHAIRAELPGELASLVSEVEKGGEGPQESDVALTDEIRRLAEEVRESEATKQSERWRSALAHELAVQGAAEVAHAAEMGAVETLLLEPGTDAKREAFFLRAGSETDAGVELVGEGTGLHEGVGAILRYRMNA